MIYIIQKQDQFDPETYISEVYESDMEDAEQLYRDFMIELASEIGCVINEHWLNIMNHENHHPEMSKEQHREKAKQWNLTLKSIPFTVFLKQHCGGKQVEYTKVFL